MPAKKKTVKTSKTSGSDINTETVKYLIGVSASPEGADSLRLLIRHLQMRRGTACIVVQNISAEPVSLPADLLGKDIKVRVVTPIDGEILIPDRVYIIPPNKVGQIKEGCLKLSAPKQKSHSGSPVDILFRSIAKSYGKDAIVVMLSGAEPNGVAGAKAIKKAGGTVIVHKPEETADTSMLPSPLRAGAADLELDAVEIASYLNSIGKTGNVAPSALKIDPQSQEISELFDMVYKVTQMDANLYKQATLIRQVERRMRTLGLNSIAEYITYIQSYTEELRILQRSFLISVTSFFRDQVAFRALERALKEVVSNKKQGDVIRVWVPGCATGEEAYSIAILLKEIIGSRSNELDIRIFATDVDVDALEYAREAVYPPSALEHITHVRRERYFTREGNSYKICKAIREICVFSVHDIVRHPPFMRMDVISCRNLLIYFKPALQEQLFFSFHYALNPNGLLLLGKSESIGPASKLFETEDARNKIFRRKHAVVSYPSQVDTRSVFTPFNRQVNAQSQDGMNTLFDHARDVLISQYAPSSILISMSFDLLHFFGNAKRYLDFPKGAANFSLFSLCLPELRGEMKTLCYRITQEGTNHIAGLPTEVTIDGKLTLLRLFLRRVPIGKDGSEFAILITFEELGSPHDSKLIPNASQTAVSELATQEIQRLRQELADTREHLQAVIEELEASNEELQSLNEELQSSSEELQASNEELQSSNEELTTLNDELHNKSIELVDLNTTLTNIQDSIHMGLIVVDKEGRVVRYNELAVRVFGLMQDDIGKYLYRVPCHLELTQLSEKINDVIEIGAPIMERVQQGDYHYLMQIAPYLNEDEKRTGAVLTFADITSLQQAEVALRETSLKLDATVKAGRIGLWEYDIKSNKTFYSPEYKSLIGFAADEIGDSLEEWQSRVHPDDLQPTLNTVYGYMNSDKRDYEVEYRLRHKEGSYRWILVKASIVRDQKGNPVKLLGAQVDITERKQAEEELRVALAKYKTLFESLPLGITVADRSGQIVESNRMAEKLLGLTPQEQMKRQIGGQEWQIVRQDGTTMPPEEYASVRALKENRIIENVEMGILKPSGPITWISVTSAPLDLKELGVVITYADITDRKYAQDELRRSEARLHLAQEAANSGTWEWDLRTNQSYWSDELWKLHGLEDRCGNVTYEFWLESIHPDDREKAGLILQEAARRGSELNTEWRVINPDGSEYWLMTRGRPLFDVAGKPERFIGITMDITERKHAETALKESEERFKSIFYTSPDAVIISRVSDGVFVDINQSVTRLTGYTREDTIGKSSYDIHIWFDLADREELVRGLNEIGYYENLPFKFRRKDGSVGIGIMSAGIILLQGVPHIISITRDITSIKEAEIALAESEARLKSILSTAPVGIGLVVDRVMTDVNEMMTSMTGYSRDELVGASARILYPSDEEYRRIGTLRNDQIKQKGFGTIETVWQHKNGSIIHIILSSSAIDRTDPQKGVTFAAQDITERKLAEMRLQESEERFRLTFYTSPDAIALSQIKDGRYIDVNDGFYRVTGYLREEVIGRTSIELNLWHNPDERNKLVKALSENGYCENLEVSMRRKDGSIANALISAKTITFDGKTHIMSILRDVTDLRLAQKAIKESEERFRLTFYTSPDAININRAEDGTYVNVNDSFCRITGYTREEILGKTSLSLGIWHNPEDHNRLVQELEEKGCCENLEAEFRCKDGSFIIGLLSARTISLQGTPHVICVTRDVTEHRRAERAIKESEERFRQAFSTSPDAICVLSHGEGVFVEVNASFSRLTGYTGEEVIGKSAMEMNFWYDLKDREEFYRRLKEEGYCENMEATFRLKGDRIDIGLLSAGVIFFKGVPHVIATIRSITDRKRMEEKLRVSEEKYRLLSENATDIIWAFDIKTEHFTYISPSIKALRGYTPDEAMAIGLEHTLTPESYRNVKAELNTALEKELHSDHTHEASKLIELHEYCKDGAIVYTEAKVKFIRDEKGSPTGLIGITRDITDRKRAENALKESEGRYRTMITALSEGVVIFNKDGRVIGCNRSAEQILGLTEAEMRSKPDLLTGWQPVREDGSPFPIDELPLVKTLSTGIPQHGVIMGDINPAGQITWLVVNCEPILDNLTGKPNSAVISFMDITDRFYAEQQLRKLSMAVEQSPAIIVITNAEGIIQYVNPTFETVTGYSGEEAVGENARILKSGKQGLTFYQNLWKTISAGKTWEGRFINRKKDGTFYTEEATISPLRDIAGRVMNYVAVKRDVTDHLRLNEEREKLKEQLVQAQKMESVGRLAGGVAHDFNNMLQAILGYVDMMLEDVRLSEVVHSRLLEVRKAAQRSADLVRQLLAFARKQPVKPKVLDLNDVITGMLKMLKPLIGEDIELQWQPGNRLWNVKIDPSQIDQLLTNLAINARDAINGVGQITIKTRNVMFDEAYCTSHPDSVPGEYVMLEVSDNGPGIDKDTLAHIFEPFFTTKSMGEGTGLGLATVYGIVKQNDGLIDVESELGNGTTFTIYLPKWMDQAAEAEHTQAPKKLQRGTETVLIVEDEESILNICKVVLKQLGYTVLAANTPSEAIRMAKDANTKIDLLVTDVIMPQMNGRELSQRLMGLLPNMKCLYISGYTADILASRGVPDEHVHFLQKPFYMKDLAAKVRQILDEKQVGG